MENVDPRELREKTVSERIVDTMWISGILGLVMYTVSSAISNMLILGYSCITGTPVVPVDRMILMTPILIGIITVGVCVIVALIDSALYRYTNRPETNEKKE